MDNHYPKKPHIHIDEDQFDYDYKTTDQLIQDFRDLVLKHFGKKI